MWVELEVHPDLKCSFPYICEDTEAKHCRNLLCVSPQWTPVLYRMQTLREAIPLGRSCTTLISAVKFFEKWLYWAVEFQSASPSLLLGHIPILQTLQESFVFEMLPPLLITPVSVAVFQDSYHWRHWVELRVCVPRKELSHITLGENVPFQEHCSADTAGGRQRPVCLPSLQPSTHISWSDPAQSILLCWSQTSLCN